MKKLFLFACLELAGVFCSNTALAEQRGNGQETNCNGRPSEAPLPSSDERCGVTDAECVAYLEGLGYTSVVVVSYQGCNSICDTSNSYNTKVLITNGIITGYEDMPQ